MIEPPPLHTPERILSDLKEVEILAKMLSTIPTDGKVYANAAH
jgi:hypothetical protein